MLEIVKIDEHTTLKLVDKIVLKDFWQCTNCGHLEEEIIVSPAPAVSRCPACNYKVREWRITKVETKIRVLVPVKPESCIKVPVLMEKGGQKLQTGAMK